MFIIDVFVAKKRPINSKGDDVFTFGIVADDPATALLIALQWALTKPSVVMAVKADIVDW